MLAELKLPCIILELPPFLFLTISIGPVQDAILLTLHEKPEITHEFEDAYYKLAKDAEVKQESPYVFQNGNPYVTSPVQEIKRYRVQTLPPKDVWIDIAPGIQFMRYVHAVFRLFDICDGRSDGSSEFDNSALH